MKCFFGVLRSHKNMMSTRDIEITQHKTCNESLTYEKGSGERVSRDAHRGCPLDKVVPSTGYYMWHHVHYRSVSIYIQSKRTRAHFFFSRCTAPELPAVWRVSLKLLWNYASNTFLLRADKSKNPPSSSNLTKPNQTEGIIITWNFRGNSEQKRRAENSETLLQHYVA